MTPASFKELYTRELDNLFDEISALDEKHLWTISGEVKNSPGNICLHLLGNINHYIGAVIGGNGYIRNRDEEFSLKDIPKETLLKNITATKKVVDDVFSTLNPATLQNEFSFERFGNPSTEYMLTYFFGHLMYHLGQINYYRRLITQN